MSPEQIDEVARTGQPLTHVTIEAPVTGHVLLRNAFPGQRISPENELYVIADLSRVWIMADVFEFDAPNVRLGQHAVVRLPYTSGARTFHASVTYIQPQLEAETRTLKVRLEAANPGLVLKPDMYVDVDFHLPQRERLMVPAEAVLDTGLRKTVFVDLGNGYLEPREVETGERAADRIVIRSGLKPGERIVVSGNFLIDSEAQLKSALGNMGAPGHSHGEPKKPGTGHKAPEVHRHD
jgi:RND family efflux transporter MFP subunit